MTVYEDTRRRPPERFVRESIRFLSEQDGPPERELKSKLQSMFEDCASVDRAYLARVEYDDPSSYNVALCIRILGGRDDVAMINAVSDVFEQMFGTGCYMDVIFLSEDQEHRLQKVCTPFFVRSRASQGQ